MSYYSKGSELGLSISKECFIVLEVIKKGSETELVLFSKVNEGYLPL